MFRRRIARLSVVILLLGALNYFARPHHEPVSSSDVRNVAIYTGSALSGEGVDACSYYSSSTWNAFFLKPHMWGLGFYIGGETASAVGCYIASSAWVNNLNQDWYAMPIWDGLQAPCSGNTERMSSTPSTAGSEGSAAASHAIAAAQSLGIGATNIIYLDMEAYSSTCVTPVRYFADGWVEKLHASGYKAGIYGSACSPNMTTYASISHPPDDVWVADYNNVDSASTSSVSCVSTSDWTGQRRIHQYHGTINQSYNGVTVSVDKDCVYGYVDGQALSSTSDICG